MKGFGKGTIAVALLPWLFGRSAQAAHVRAPLAESGAARELGVDELRTAMQDAWVAAASEALDANPVSFALLPMGDLLGPGNYLAPLQARGDRVQLPDGLTAPEQTPPASASSGRH